MTSKIAYSVKEAAKLLGVSRAWLYHLWAGGVGPPRYKIGARTLVPVDGLEAWLKRHEVEPQNVRGAA